MKNNKQFTFMKIATGCILIILFPYQCFGQVSLDIHGAPEELRVNPSFEEYGRREEALKVDVPPVRRHARFEAFEVHDEGGLSRGNSTGGRAFATAASDAGFPPRLNLSRQSQTGWKTKFSPKTITAPEQPSANRKTKTRSSNIRKWSRQQPRHLNPTNKTPKTTSGKGSDSLSGESLERGRNALQEGKKQRHFMPVEELVTKQFKRVVDVAEKLDILEPINTDRRTQMVIASPAGSPDRGSVSQMLLSTAGKGVSGYKLRRGPYEDAYHTQIMDDYSGVMNMLGTSVKERQEPNMNFVLSHIQLKDGWDIYRL